MMDLNTTKAIDELLKEIDALESMKENAFVSKKVHKVAVEMYEEYMDNTFDNWSN